MNLANHTGDVCTTDSGCEEGVGSGAAGAMNRPHDVKVLPSGQLVVSDDENNRIDVFATGGDFVRTFGKGVNATDNRDVCTMSSVCQAGTSADDDAGHSKA